jgi:formylglycine-generating enzyme required for sulfatase activity
MAGKYALLIGASTFGEGGPAALAAPEADVAALRDVLADDRIAGFAPGDIRFALNEGLEETRRKINWLFNGRNRDDFLVLYYTGHGFKDPHDSRLYLALKGTETNAPWIASLEANYVKDLIQRSRSDRKLVILDCCHSGAVGAGDVAVKRGAETAVETETFSPKGYGTVTLASSTATQASFEVDGASAYTRRLAEALRTGAADPGASEITAHALHDYLSRNVTADMRAKGVLMEPVMYAAGTVPLVIARNPNPHKPLPAALIEHLQGGDEEKAEYAAIKLGEIMAGADARQAEDARRVLAERLRQSAGLAYLVGQRIESILGRHRGDIASPGPEVVDAGAAPVEETVPPPVILSDGAFWRGLRFLQALVGSGLFVVPAVIALAGVFIIPYIPGVLPDNRPGPTTQAAGTVLPKDCPQCPEMVVIPAGSFMMGSPESEEGRSPYEGPRHEVRFQRPFALARTEVTFDQWQACVEDGGCDRREPPDQGWGRGGRPVINVSWTHARAYVDWLNTKVAGSPYRLPSEAEWEYAVRAGTTGPFSTGETITAAQANCDMRTPYGNAPAGEFRGRSVPVGDLEAENAWGLRHMHGNVLEWTADCWHEDYKGAPPDGSAWVEAKGASCSSGRVVRGGSWGNYPWNCRAAFRLRGDPADTIGNLGFRPARTL